MDVCYPGLIADRERIATLILAAALITGAGLYAPAAPFDAAFILALSGDARRAAWQGILTLERDFIPQPEGPPLEVLIPQDPLTLYPFLAHVLAVQSGITPPCNRPVYP